MTVPRAMTPPPIQSQRTMGFTAMATLTRFDAPGDETSVRYTSSFRPVRTDGVPMPCELFGNEEIDGA